MIELGVFNLLKANRKTEHGFYLANEKNEEVLLPNKYVPQNFNIGDELSVFVYLDSEERVTATTLTPKIKLYEYACLKVVDVNDFGAYLNWGLEKDLFCPFREQTRKMRVGEYHIVYMYLDGKTDRLAASSNINKFIEKDKIELDEGEEVRLLICGSTELGFKAIINNTYIGLIYSNEIFQPIKIGDEITGYIKQLREDNKIDLSLQKVGYEAIEPNAQKLMDELKLNNGTLYLTDKSSPEEIIEKLQMSKKVFKKAIGALYKQKYITLKKDCIVLN